MLRPCFLVIDREYSSSISTRKLVIETAKLNVITAYSSAEAIETLAKFPAVDGVVMDANLKDMPCSELCRKLRQIHPKLTIIAISGVGRHACDGADYLLESFAPAALLELIKSLDPASAKAIEAHNEELSAEE